MIIATEGKTLVEIIDNVHQTRIRRGDRGFIDGYVRGGDGVPKAVFVRLSDGLIDLVPTYSIAAAQRGREE